MSRFLLRFTAIMALLFGLIVSGCLVLGAALPPEPLAIFLTGLPDSTLLISRVDVRSKVVFNQRVPNVVNYPYAIDPGCHVLFPTRIANELSLSAINLQTGGTDSYFAGDYSINNAEWLPDNRHLWVVYNTYSAAVMHYTIVDAATKAQTPVHLPGSDTRLPISLSWSPAGDYGVLYGLHSGAAHSYASGALERFAYLLDIHTGTYQSLEYSRTAAFFWSRDGRYLAYVDSGRRLIVLDMPTHTLHRHEFAEVHYGTGIDWTPDNTLQFFARYAETDAYQGYRWSPATGTLQKIPLTLPAAGVSKDMFPGRAWSPDGRWLFYPDAKNNIHIVATTTGSEAAIAAPRNRFLNHFWSPDSRYLVSYSDNPPTFTFMDINAGHIARLYLDMGVTTFNDFARAWATASEPGLFISKISTLGRVVFRDGVPQFRPEFQLPKAYLAALCYMETSS